MKRTDLMDTKPEAYRRLLRLLQEKGTEWRINKTFEMIDGSRAAFPEQTRRSVLALRKAR